MTIVFYISAVIALASTLLVITRTNAVHALLYLVVSLLAVALVFFTLGAPFIAALEIIVYAGAIMVLFVFVMMLLNLGGKAARVERQWLAGHMYIGPTILSGVLAAMFVYIIAAGSPQAAGHTEVGPQQVGVRLFSTYLFAVELAAMMLLAGLIGAFHIGRPAESGDSGRRAHGHPLRGTAEEPSATEEKEVG